MLWKILIRPLQHFSVPISKIGCGFIGFLEKAEQKPIGILCQANGLIRQDEHAEIIIVSACGRSQHRLCIAFRLGIGIGIERRFSIAAIARPEAAAADFMRIGFFIDPGSDVRRMPCRRGSTPAGKARNDQVETAPEKMHRTCLSQER
jgi:hypothetical protein